MSMYALLRNNPQPTMHDIQEAFQGVVMVTIFLSNIGVNVKVYFLNKYLYFLFWSYPGNLCRCTGYRPILEGYRTFTKVEELV